MGLSRGSGGERKRALQQSSPSGSETPTEDDHKCTLIHSENSSLRPQGPPEVAVTGVDSEAQGPRKFVQTTLRVHWAL